MKVTAALSSVLYDECEKVSRKTVGHQTQNVHALREVERVGLKPLQHTVGEKLQQALLFREKLSSGRALFTFYIQR